MKNTGNRDQGTGIRDSGDFEETLRLVARLAAPEGLEERVQAGLRVAPRKARILAWPSVLRIESAWMRSAAAAAIVAVVVGGGWVVSSRVHPAQPAQAITIPQHGVSQGGFSSAGAMRTPQTLNGPVVTQPAETDAKPATKATIGHGKAASKTIAQPSAPAEK
jgi:hypothetical protein